MSEHVKTELTNGILVLTLHRPEKKNALTGAMYDALSDNLERAETDSAIKVVLSRAMATVSPPATTWPTSPRRPTAGTARKVLLFVSLEISARRPSR
jgi:hypothetical protein